MIFPMIMTLLAVMGCKTRYVVVPEYHSVESKATVNSDSIMSEMIATCDSVTQQYIRGRLEVDSIRTPDGSVVLVVHSTDTLRERAIHKESRDRQSEKRTESKEKATLADSTAYVPKKAVEEKRQASAESKWQAWQKATVAIAIVAVFATAGYRIGRWLRRKGY